MSKHVPRLPPPTRTRYGGTNPERVTNNLWEMAVRRNWQGYDLRRHVGLSYDGDWGTPSASDYRDTIPGPFWSWKRFGRTRTSLPDGRVIRVAGEHEDWYDRDFCIYNDVLVTCPGGRLEFYLYPKAVFPPTDFHTATLVGTDIILIGSLGYYDLRRFGETQVLKLDTRTLRITPVATRGEPPGWISRHKAELEDQTGIRISGGDILSAEGKFVRNTSAFVLELPKMKWRRATT